MENIDIEQIESYLRGKMTSEERAQFESVLAADPELRRRTDELRQFANDLRQVARADLRKRVEAVRDQIKQEEANLKAQPKTGPNPTAMLAIGILIGTLLGLALGWMLFDKGSPPPPPLSVPVALAQYDTIATLRIPGPQPGDTISFTVSHNPDLDSTDRPVRKYALDPGGVGLCIYARRDDDFWKQPLELSQSGSQFFLKIGNEKFLLIDDGEEQPFPEKPFGN